VAGIDQVRTISPEIHPPAVKASGTVRYGFVDLLRGLALVVMVETHVVNAYLPAGSRQSPFFFWLAFLNGLVAPSFLFASGYSLVLQGSRHWDDWLHFRMPFWRHLRRLGFIVILGYLIHAQHLRLSQYLISGDPDISRRALQVDILQCIVASLLITHALILTVRTRFRLAYAAGATAIAISVATPSIWTLDFAGRLPLALALFLNPGGVSLFPIFPWAAFLLAGSVASCLFLSSVEAGTGPRFMRRLSITGAGLIGAGLLGRLIPFSLPGYQDFFLTSPLYLAIRLGCVLLLLAALWRMERIGVWFSRSVVTAGQESLLVYGLHLFIIFGLLRNRYLGRILGLEAGYAGCFILSALLIILMLWAAHFWHSFKRQHSLLIRRTQALMLSVLAAVFLFG
jgi:uncharacterized membrane protein